MAHLHISCIELYFVEGYFCQTQVALSRTNEARPA